MFLLGHIFKVSPYNLWNPTPIANLLAGSLQNLCWSYQPIGMVLYILAYYPFTYINTILVYIRTHYFHSKFFTILYTYVKIFLNFVSSFYYFCFLPIRSVAADIIWPDPPTLSISNRAYYLCHKHTKNLCIMIYLKDLKNLFYPFLQNNLNYKVN